MCIFLPLMCFVGGSGGNCVANFQCDCVLWRGQLLFLLWPFDVDYIVHNVLCLGISEQSFFCPPFSFSILPMFVKEHLFQKDDEGLRNELAELQKIVRLMTEFDIIREMYDSISKENQIKECCRILNTRKGFQNPGSKLKHCYPAKIALFELSGGGWPWMEKLKKEMQLPASANVNLSYSNKQPVILAAMNRQWCADITEGNNSRNPPGKNRQ